MELEQLALLAEILGGVGVVASLLYLAFEVRKQGRLNRSDAASKFAASWSDIMASMHDDPELSAIWLKGLSNFDELTDVDKLRFSTYFGRVLKISESLHVQLLTGTLDKMTWRGIERVIRDIIAHSGAQAWWKTRQHWYTDDFQDLIAGIIADSDARPLFQDITPDNSH